MQISGELQLQQWGNRKVWEKKKKFSWKEIIKEDKSHKSSLQILTSLKRWKGQPVPCGLLLARNPLPLLISPLTFPVLPQVDEPACWCLLHLLWSAIHVQLFYFPSIPSSQRLQPVFFRPFKADDLELSGQKATVSSRSCKSEWFRAFFFPPFLNCISAIVSKALYLLAKSGVVRLCAWWQTPWGWSLNVCGKHLAVLLTHWALFSEVVVDYAFLKAFLLKVFCIVCVSQTKEKLWNAFQHQDR